MIWISILSLKAKILTMLQRWDLYNMARGQEEYIINRFDLGLNTKATRYNMAPEESPDLQNVTFDDLGAVGTRAGYSAFLSTPLNSYAIDGLHGYVKSDGTSYLVAGGGDLLFRMSGNTGVTIPSAQSVLTAGEPQVYRTFQNQMWVANGYNTYKWNGTEFTQWGVSAPSAATAAVNSAGTQTGQYRWVVLGVNSNSAQGNYGSATTEVSLTSERAYITSMPIFATSAGVNEKIICRNTAAGSGVYWVVTTVSNAQNVYEDNHDDSELITLAPTDNYPPPNFTVFTEHLGRVFGAAGNSANPSYLWYSDQDEPETYGVAAFERIGQGDGYKITGLATLADYLLVIKGNDSGGGSIYILYTPDGTPANWSLTKLDTESGGDAEKVVVRFANFVMYMNKNGVYDLNQHALGVIKTDSLSFNIESEIYALAEDYLKNAAAYTWKNKVWLSVPYGAVTANNRVYQYDYVRGRGATTRKQAAWAKFTNLAISDFTTYDGKLFGGSSAANGKIFELDTAWNDEGSAINSYFKTFVIRGKKGHENATKVWRRVQMLVDTPGDWNMTLTYTNPDFGEVGTSAEINLDPDDADWGTAIWDTNKWGAGFDRRTVEVVFRNSVSKGIQLKLRQFLFMGILLGKVLIFK